MTALRSRVGWQLALVTVVTVALLALAAQRALAWQDERQRADDEVAAAKAATTEVVGLIDISSETTEKDLDELLDGATAGFRTEFEAQAESLRKALDDNSVTSTGEAASTGVVKLDGRKATVIVAATGTVKNKSTKKAEPRNYRLKVDLQKVDDRWLVSGLEFVA